MVVKGEFLVVDTLENVSAEEVNETELALVEEEAEESVG